DDPDWDALAIEIAQPWARQEAYRTLAGRLAEQDELDRALGAWTSDRDRIELARVLRAAGVPSTAVLSPQERIDEDANSGNWGLWPRVVHSEMGEVRVDGLPVHLSETDWEMRHGAPCLGEHNQKVFGDLLGHSTAELDAFREEGVI
ncbi:MAG: CoA transferase, partial [Myxococcota bacterium]